MYPYLITRIAPVNLEHKLSTNPLHLIQFCVVLSASLQWVPIPAFQLSLSVPLSALSRPFPLPLFLEVPCRGLARSILTSYPLPLTDAVLFSATFEHFTEDIHINWYWSWVVCKPSEPTETANIAANTQWWKISNQGRQRFSSSRTWEWWIHDVLTVAIYSVNASTSNYIKTLFEQSRNKNKNKIKPFNEKG